MILAIRLAGEVALCRDLRFKDGRWRKLLDKSKQQIFERALADLFACAIRFRVTLATDVTVDVTIAKDAAGNDQEDYDAVAAQIESDCKRFNVVDFGADRWLLEYVRQRLRLPEDKCIAFGQGFQSMSAPAKARPSEIGSVTSAALTSTSNPSRARLSR